MTVFVEHNFAAIKLFPKWNGVSRIYFKFILFMIQISTENKVFLYDQILS